MYKKINLIRLMPNFFIKKTHFIKLLAAISILIILSSCGGKKIWDPADARKIDPNVDVRARQAIQEGRGVSLEGAVKGRGKGGVFEFATSNYLWRATLEVLEFIPLANVDYGGGLIITDWYNEETASNESLKITVRFLSNEIRADGLRIIVYKKVCTINQNCIVKKIRSNLEKEVKDAILTKAVKIERGLLDKQRKEYIKKYGDDTRRIKEAEDHNR